MSDSNGEDYWAQLASSLDVAAGPTVTVSDPPAAGEGGGVKRRRRRRSRKKTTGEAVVAPADVDVLDAELDESPAPELPEEEPAAELDENGEPKKRRRRRSRRKKVEAGEAGDTAEGTTAVAEEDDDGPPVTVAHLPTWQELIDGLHRP
ncbi:MAG: hypothetical protein K1X57_13180 [Gemmataceae bacterium]|nr:hypothetical protein [Gemmataceae bacterium]